MTLPFRDKAAGCALTSSFVRKIGHRKNTFHLTTGETPAVTLERDREGCALSFHSCVLCFHPIRLKDHARLAEDLTFALLSITMLLISSVLAIF